MERRDTISVLRNVLSVLKKHRELTFNQLQKETHTQWRTLVRCIDFLKDFSLIKERRGDGKPHPERFFSLK